MATSIVTADSLLAIDVGAVNTRALLFDVVEGKYRFLALGSASSTAVAPFRHISEGVHLAILQLQEITGRTLLGEDQRVIIPSQPGGAGVDACVATISAGKPLKVVAVGLLEDISTQSAQNLASATYAQVVDVLSLNDRRKQAARIDSILRLRPDLIVVAGGTEKGASHSVLNLLESVGLACYLFPEADRPEVLFAGNQSLTEEVKSSLQSFSFLHLAPNLRPTFEVEQLGPAQAELAQIYRIARSKKIPGVQDLDGWAGGNLMPTASAFGRMIRCHSRFTPNPGKSALGVDIGASATTIAAAFAGELVLGVYPQYGLGESLSTLLSHTNPEEINRWMTAEVSDDYIRNYLQNKAIYPTAIPATVEDLSLEQALARVVLRMALRKASNNFPRKPGEAAPSLLPSFDPIIAAGSVITCAATRGQSLLMLLDALQPTGYTSIWLDQYNILPALGAAATVNPLLTVQEASDVVPLGVVVSPVGEASYGTPALRVRVSYESGDTTTKEVKYGALEAIPLPIGKSASLSLQPLHRFDAGWGPGRGGAVKNVPGGPFGIVIDARGRPLRLTSDAAKRREMLKKWLNTLGG
jgi:MutL protein